MHFARREAALLLLLVVACGGEDLAPRAPHTAQTSSPPSPAPPAPTPHAVASPFPYGDHVEYQNGLAAMLVTAPLFGSESVTSLFRWGYLVGMQEGEKYELTFDFRFRSVGCLTGVGALQKEAGIDTSSEPCETPEQKAEADSYGIKGKIFSAQRLKMVQQGADHLSPDEMSLRELIFVVAYNMGFAHAWTSIDHDARTLRGFSRSLQTKSTAHLEGLSSNQLTSISNRCGNGALEAANKYGPFLRCLLANKEMNGDLSGQANLSNCPVEVPK